MKKDLTGQRFGRWLVKGTSAKDYDYWECVCDCGTVRSVRGRNLLIGASRSCGCLSAERKQIKKMKTAVEKYLNKRFGRLLVKSLDYEKSKTVATCICDCGRECKVNTRYLSKGATKSCGCYKKEENRKHGPILNAYREKIKDELFKDGTALHSFDQVVSKNNTTGIKGVSKMKNGKFRAYITLKRKQIHLGSYDTQEEAAKARMAGEEKYYQPILDKYNKEEE